MTTHLDGNVLAGTLGEVFAVDVTTAVGQCASCGTRQAMGQSLVYTDAPGLVARCPICGEVVLRVTRSPGRTWLDLRGVSYLELHVPGESADLSMSNLPQPADRRHLRVSDADREQAAELLRQAAGDGRITFEELDDRLEAAYASRTYGDLSEVTADLPAPGQPHPGPLATAPGRSRRPDRRGTRAGISARSSAGGPGREVGGTPAASVVAVLGGVQLDLREARFSQPEVTIDIFTLMGGVDITVGEDVEVDVSGFGIMGGFDHRAPAPACPARPRCGWSGSP